MKKLVYFEIECFSGLAERHGLIPIPMVGQWKKISALIKGTIKEINQEITYIMSNIDLFKDCNFHFATWEDLDKLKNTKQVK